MNPNIRVDATVNPAATINPSLENMHQDRVKREDEENVQMHKVIGEKCVSMVEI